MVLDADRTNRIITLYCLGMRGEAFYVFSGGVHAMYLTWEEHRDLIARWTAFLEEHGI